MAILTYSLAEDETAAWRIVFDRDDLLLYIAFEKNGVPAKPIDWISVDDFLACRPRDDLHKRALERFLMIMSCALTAKPE
ncbi:hypothetical protein [Paramesorhizobium deserti]|uniref:hypothetical protein n=1 Tax=Paramesorhizobium deserti TaxID=1494590 RepID=UPI0012905A3D|nr:hypothetical protein [Paramesorhizobium deserti]